MGSKTAFVQIQMVLQGPPCRSSMSTCGNLLSVTFAGICQQKVVSQVMGVFSYLSYQVEAFTSFFHLTHFPVYVLFQ